MSFTNPPRQDIEDLLRRAHVIAVVGLSDNPFRTSNGVAAAMQRHGYRMVPINPSVRSALGEPAFSSLARATSALGTGAPIDIVNVFRRPEHVAGIVDECIELRLPALWLQEGVVDAAAAARAQAAGMFVVMNRCIIKERTRI